MEHNHSGPRAYAQSKLALIRHTFEPDREDRGDARAYDAVERGLWTLSETLTGVGSEVSS